MAALRYELDPDVANDAIRAINAGFAELRALVGASAPPAQDEQAIRTDAGPPTSGE